MCWGIMGVSLRQSRTHDALLPQAGLYTVSIRDTDEHGTPRERLQVIGNLLEILIAPEHSGAVLERIAHADTRIISLTITEKGYCHNPATGALDFEHPDIEHDLQDAKAPRSAIGFLVRGLQRRRLSGRTPIALMSLDNLPQNGEMLRNLVLAFADGVDTALKEWIAAGCTFPNSMVDRIVPHTTDADRERISAHLGLRDAWPVVTEPFFEWAVEDRFAAGRPRWEHGGARFVADVRPYEKLKLRMVNGTHSALAYLGVVAGFATVDRAMAQPALRNYIEALMREEIEPTLPAIPGINLKTYRELLLRRYMNPALQHRTQQIAMDGSQKLPQRLLGTVRDRLRSDAPIDRLALAVAGWLHYLQGMDEAGHTYTIADPLAEALAEHMTRARRMCASMTDVEQAERCVIERFTSFHQVFGELSNAPRFVRAVARHTRSLRDRGVLATVESWG